MLALYTIKGYGSPETAESATRALELGQRAGMDLEKYWSAFVIVASVEIVRSHIRRGREIATDLVERAERNGNLEHIGEGLNILALVDMFRADFELAMEEFNRSAAMYEAAPKAEPGAGQLYRQVKIVDNRTLSAWNLFFLGYPDQALEKVRSALTLAHESGAKPVLDSAYDFAAVVYHLRRDLGDEKSTAEASIAVATELGDLFRIAVGGMYLGWAAAMAGNPRLGLALMQPNLADFRANGSEGMTRHMLALIATIHGLLKQFDEALSTIEEAFPIIEQSSERCYEAEIHRLKGDLLLASDSSSDTAGAQVCFRMAIEIARRQKARSWELRATTSLARLLRDTNRRDEAREMLAEIYSWFTEGFDTADLRDAKALLEELA
jgi:tetratricopeptide (TPR) repeat protein